MLEWLEDYRLSSINPEWVQADWNFNITLFGIMLQTFISLNTSKDFKAFHAKII